MNGSAFIKLLLGILQLRKMGVGIFQKSVYTSFSNCTKLRNYKNSCTSEHT